MRFMIIRHADEETEAGTLPSAELMTAMIRYNEELARAGVMRGGEGLHPSSTGVRVEFASGRPRVVDGPFTEAKELVAGFTIIEVGSRDEAVEWLMRWPVEDADGNVRLELRQVFEAEDFGEVFTPELRDAEQRMREQVAERGR